MKISRVNARRFAGRDVTSDEDSDRHPRSSGFHRMPYRFNVILHSTDVGKKAEFTGKAK